MNSKTQNHKIRKIKNEDFDNIFNLYKKSATIKEGIARKPEEITKKFISEILEKSINQGVGIVIENENSELISCLTGNKLEAKNFCHTLSNLTLAVDPHYFGQNLGKKSFIAFINEISNNHLEIMRVELNVRRTNKRAIKIYEEVGFKVEGVMKNRLLDSNGDLSDDSFMAWMNPNFKK